MSRSANVLILATTAVLFPSSLVLAASHMNDVRFMFAGDTVLSREVAHEIFVRGDTEPLKAVTPLFKKADWIAANLEGVVGDPKTCIAEISPNLCFSIDPRLLATLKRAGLSALVLENNHRADLGEASRQTTTKALLENTLTPLTYERSPVFFDVRGTIIAVIPLSLVPDVRGQVEKIPSQDLARKLSLAKRLSNVVVVSIHWGAELVDWPQDKQREQARWLIGHGADVIVGHHPHVVVAPECLDGKPVFFSLGNFLFDQKYPLTKTGLIADCTISNGALHCAGQKIVVPPSSSFPQFVGPDKAVGDQLSGCNPATHPVLSAGDVTLRPWPATAFGDEIALDASRNGRSVWRTQTTGLLGIDVGHLAAGTTEPLVLTLEEHFSSIDSETGPRPYVYRIGHNGLIALWRGSALAWPIIDTKLMRNNPDHLCVLHRGDSFVTLDPLNKATRVAVYDWDGFGFKGNDAPQLTAACEQAFAP